MRRYLPEQTWVRVFLTLLIVFAVVSLVLESLDGRVSAVGLVGSALALLVLGLVLPPILSRPRELAQLRDAARRHVRGPVMHRGERLTVTSLLDPLYEVAHFEGRSSDLAALDRFLQAPEPSLMIVSGPPWSGKTRLVAHWASSAGERWKGGWVIPGHAREAVETAFATGDPTLVLVDGFGADAGHVMDALEGGSKSPVRMVLVVDEHVDVVDVATRHSTTAGHVARSARTRQVGHLGDRSDHTRWYPRMVRDYATALGRPSAGLGELPPGVQSNSIGLLNAFALATVAHGRNAGINPALTDLLKNLWETQVRDWHAELTHPRWGLVGISESQVDSAAAATLLGFDPSHEDAADQLGRMPSWNGTGLDVRTNACDFLREAVWPQRAATQPAAVMAHLVSWRGDRREAVVSGLVTCGAATMNRLLGAVLVAAPMVKGTGSVLEQLIGDRKEVLENAVTLVRERGRATSEIDKAIAHGIKRCVLTAEQVGYFEEALPRHLGRARAELAAVSVHWHREHGTDFDLADALNGLAFLQYDLGQHQEALASGEESVALFRRLLADSKNGPPENYMHKFAVLLNNLAGVLDYPGRHQDALAAANESAALFRQLLAHPDIETGEDHYMHHLAASLTNRANRLADLKRHQEALDSHREAVGLLRRLADPDTGDPEAHHPELAASLNNLAGVLLVLGRHQEAIDLHYEAVGLLRRLADPDTGNPEVHAPALANALNNLAGLLAQFELHRKALAPAEEAVALNQRLADPDTGNPQAHTPALARSLDNLANRLLDLARHQEALARQREAVAAFRRLTDPHTGNPQAYTPDLSRSLIDLAGVLAAAGRHEAALATCEEAVTLSRQLLTGPNTGDPDAYMHDLARSLKTYTDVLVNMNRHREAVAPVEEAITLLRQLLAVSESIELKGYTTNLALSLHNLAGLLIELGRLEEALAPAEEAVALYRQLANPATGNPDVHTTDLTLALGTLAAVERALAQERNDDLAP